MRKENSGVARPPSIAVISLAQPRCTMGLPLPATDRDSDHFLLNGLAVFFQVDRILPPTACSLSGTRSVCPLSSLVF